MGASYDGGVAKSQSLKVSKRRLRFGEVDPTNSDYLVDYARGLATIREETYDAIVVVLREELPYAWLERYQRMCDGPANVLKMSVGGFDYLFDFCSNIGVTDREDRVVVTFGLSRAAENPRPASRMKGFPTDAERGDRGHLIAHGSGGGVDINLVHQDPRLNRGWSPEGKRYRELERYTAAHPGTFFFSRPIYDDATARPSAFELGVLRPDRAMWIELFENATSL